MLGYKTSKNEAKNGDHTMYQKNIDNCHAESMETVT